MKFDKMRELAGLPPAVQKAVLVETVVAEEPIAIVAEEVEVKDQNDAAPGLEVEKVPAVKVPSDVYSAITKRVAELQAAIKLNDEKGYNDGSVKVNAIDALEQIADNLKKEDGLTKANLFYHTLMGPILELIPPVVIKFLHKHKPTQTAEAVAEVPAAEVVVETETTIVKEAVEPEFKAKVVEFGTFLNGYFANIERNGGSHGLAIEDKYGEHFLQTLTAAQSAVDALMSACDEAAPFEQ